MKIVKLFLVLLIFLPSTIRAQWQMCVSLPNGDSGTDFVANGNNIFAATTWGIYLSTDNGNTWNTANVGLTQLFVSSLAISGTNVFAATVDGIFLSKDNGSSWTSINSSFTNTNINKLIGNGSQIFAGTNGDGIFSSIDNGNTWTAINSGLTNKFIHSFVINGSNIFVGTAGGVFLTMDGKNWSSVSNGLTIPLVLSLAISGGTLFAGTGGNASGGFFLSTNNGSSWTTANNGLPSGYSNYEAIATDGTNIFLGHFGYGVYLSNNNGNNWLAVHSGFIRSIAIIGTNVFVGGVSGIWKCPLNNVVGENEKIETVYDNIALFSNPVKNKLNISVLRPNLGQRIEIINIIGQSICQMNLQDEIDLDISDFPSGLYTVRLVDGSNVTIKRFIKQ